MSGAEIAAEVAAALAEASSEVGSGSPLVGKIRRRGAPAGPSYDPSYGPDDEYSFNVILDTFNERERQGTAILATDTKIFASVSTTVPKVSDRIEVDGVIYEILGIDPVNPGGSDLAYTIWARD